MAATAWRLPRAVRSVRPDFFAVVEPLLVSVLKQRTRIALGPTPTVKSCMQLLLTTGGLRHARQLR